MHPRIIDITPKATTVAEIIRNSGRSSAVVARVCKTEPKIIERWVDGQAPRYKFVAPLAKATGVDEAVVFDAVKRANQSARQKGIESQMTTPQMPPTQTDCHDAVVDYCLVALDLASMIVCLDHSQQAMIRTIAEAFANEKDGAA